MSLDSKTPQRAVAGESYGDVLRASRLNQVPDSIDEIKRYLQDQVPDRNDLGARDQRWIGEIVAKGPQKQPDFTNATYWVKMLATLPQAIADVAFQDEPIPGVFGIFPVTNMQEVKDKTHLIPVGTRVEVFYPWNSKPGTELFFNLPVETKGLHQGDIHQMVTDETAAWGPAQFGP